MLSRSHRLGRLDHGVYGGQAGAHPDRVLNAISLPEHRIHSLVMEPGDVAFTHSNLLHCSMPNLSDDWRRNLIIAFNSRSNSPLDVSVPIQPQYNPIKVLPDDAILKKGCQPLDRSRADFLGQTTTQSSVGSLKNQEKNTKDNGKGEL